ncbi:MAG: hypothetical protein U9Q03_03645 [Patescibacteria group bacterium]|nr:hypothetical protein [Patescibacteria group bacterium]
MIRDLLLLVFQAFTANLGILALAVFIVLGAISVVVFSQKRKSLAVACGLTAIMCCGIQLIRQEVRISEMAEALSVQPEEGDDTPTVEQRLRAVERGVSSFGVRMSGHELRVKGRVDGLEDQLGVVEGVANRNFSNLSRIDCNRRRCWLRR